MFTNPIKAAAYDDLLTVVELWFGDGPRHTEDANWPSGKFLMRGGICWPDKYDTETKTVQGFALVAGYNLGTDRLYLFHERAFCCIADIVDPPTRKILFEGLAPWFATVWGRYLCDSFYSNQPDNVCLRWEQEVHAMPAVQPPPRFIPCEPWRNVESAEALIWDWITRRRLEMLDDRLGQAVTGYNRREATELPAPLHALAAALTGILPNVTGAKEVASSPAARIRRIGNVLMREHERDWHEEDRP